MKIGEILVSRGLLAQAVLEKALSVQKEKPQQRISEILMEMGAFGEEELFSGLSEQLGIPFKKNFQAFFASDLVGLISFDSWQRWKAVPIREEGKIFVVSADPLRLPRLEIEEGLKSSVNLAFGLTPEIIELLERNYWRPSQKKARGDISSVTLEAPGVVAGGSDSPTTGVVVNGSTRENLLDLANKAPVIRMVNQAIFQALQQGASDIHLQPQENEFRVRYRIDGVLHDMFKLPAAMQPAVISRIKILSGLNIAERRLPQDGRTTVHLEGRPIDIRVSILPTYWGEAAVLRLLDQASFLFSLPTLGFYTDELELMEKFISSDHGIILLTGPTGSGKTTTLYAALQKINLPGRNIITLEDPVEYQIPGLSQIQVNSIIGLSFAAALRSVLRHDPDVLMVGEIRDRETADMAIQASLTGHLVFSTLHTNDAASAVTRLMEVGIEPYLISSSVLAVIAQRLVRLICNYCKEPVPASEIPVASFPPGTTIFRGRGCEHCFQTGYRGRTGIFEFFILDDVIRRQILEKKPSQELKEHMNKKGMRTLRASGEKKILEGLTTLEEVLRVTS
ncbi:MAG: ATPase, T2SS/T4P/T4SS family [Candidatus Ratteibacteria bacterium]|jgi:type II secretory ATPase GspE/PulE/Tfp pilus assembly ATPase PilB-like protein